MQHAVRQILGEHLPAPWVGGPGDVRVDTLLQKRINGRDTHQRRGSRRVTRQTRPCGIGSQLAHAAPVIDRVIEVFHEIHTQHERRTQKGALQPPADHHVFGDDTKAATDAIVDRQKAQAVLGVLAGKMRKLVTDHRTGFCSIDQPEVQDRHVQSTPLERSVGRQKGDVA